MRKISSANEQAAESKGGEPDGVKVEWSEGQVQGGEMMRQDDAQGQRTPDPTGPTGENLFSNFRITNRK